MEEGPELARASHPEVVLFGEPSPVLGDPKPGNGTMPGEPFYLIVTDKDNETFSVEGPMTDDKQWNRAVVVAQKSWRQVTCFNDKRVVRRGRRSRLAATVFREAGAAR